MTDSQQTGKQFPADEQESTAGMKLGDSMGNDRGGMLAVAAQMALEKGRPDEAADLYLQAIVARESSFGAIHRKLVPLLQALGDIYSNQQRFAEAERLFNRALNILEACPKPSKVREIDLLTSMAAMLRKAGRTDEANRVEGCCESLRKEEGQAPLLLQIARGITPSSSIDVRDINKWLDEISAKQNATHSPGRAPVAAGGGLKVTKPLIIKAMVAILVLGWIGWLVWMFTQ